MKHESRVQKNVDVLLQAAEAQEETEYKGSTSGLARGHAKSLSLGEMLVLFYCYSFLLKIHH